MYRVETRGFTHKVGFYCVLDVTSKDLKTRPKCGQGVNSKIHRVSGVNVDIPELVKGSTIHTLKAGYMKIIPNIHWMLLNSASQQRSSDAKRPGIRLLLYKFIRM